MVQVDWKSLLATPLQSGGWVSGQKLINEDWETPIENIENVKVQDKGNQHLIVEIGGPEINKEKVVSEAENEFVIQDVRTTGESRVNLEVGIENDDGILDSDLWLLLGRKCLAD